jgi:hypothetical protein
LDNTKDTSEINTQNSNNNLSIPDGSLSNLGFGTNPTGNINDDTDYLLQQSELKEKEELKETIENTSKRMKSKFLRIIQTLESFEESIDPAFISKNDKYKKLITDYEEDYNKTCSEIDSLLKKQIDTIKIDELNRVDTLSKNFLLKQKEQTSVINDLISKLFENYNKIIDDNQKIILKNETTYNLKEYNIAEPIQIKHHDLNELEIIWKFKENKSTFDDSLLKLNNVFMDQINTLYKQQDFIEKQKKIIDQLENEKLRKAELEKEELKKAELEKLQGIVMTNMKILEDNEKEIKKSVENLQTTFLLIKDNQEAIHNEEIISTEILKLSQDIFSVKTYQHTTPYSIPGINKVLNKQEDIIKKQEDLIQFIKDTEKVFIKIVQEKEKEKKHEEEMMEQKRKYEEQMKEIERQYNEQMKKLQKSFEEEKGRNDEKLKKLEEDLEKGKKENNELIKKQNEQLEEDQKKSRILKDLKEDVNRIKEEKKEELKMKEITLINQHNEKIREYEEKIREEERKKNLETYEEKLKREEERFIKKIDMIKDRERQLMEENDKIKGEKENEEEKIRMLEQELRNKDKIINQNQNEASILQDQIISVKNRLNDSQNQIYDLTRKYEASMKNGENVQEYQKELKEKEQSHLDIQNQLLFMIDKNNKLEQEVNKINKEKQEIIQRSEKDKNEHIDLLTRQIQDMLYPDNNSDTSSVNSNDSSDTNSVGSDDSTSSYKNENQRILTESIRKLIEERNNYKSQIDIIQNDYQKELEYKQLKESELEKVKKELEQKTKNIDEMVAKENEKREISKEDIQVLKDKETKKEKKEEILTELKEAIDSYKYLLPQKIFEMFMKKQPDLRDEVDKYTEDVEFKSLGRQENAKMRKALLTYYNNKAKKLAEVNNQIEINKQEINNLKKEVKEKTDNLNVEILKNEKEEKELRENDLEQSPYVMEEEEEPIVLSDDDDDDDDRDSYYDGSFLKNEKEENEKRERERKEKERKEREKIEKERKRIERERKEKERKMIEKEENGTKGKEEKDRDKRRKEREEKEEKERKEKEEKERKERKKKREENERKEKEEEDNRLKEESILINKLLKNGETSQQLSNIIPDNVKMNIEDKTLLNSFFRFQELFKSSILFKTNNLKVSQIKVLNMIKNVLNPPFKTYIQWKNIIQDKDENIEKLQSNKILSNNVRWSRLFDRLNGSNFINIYNHIIESTLTFKDNNISEAINSILIRILEANYWNMINGSLFEQVSLNIDMFKEFFSNTKTGGVIQKIIIKFFNKDNNEGTNKPLNQELLRKILIQHNNNNIDYYILKEYQIFVLCQVLDSFIGLMILVKRTISCERLMKRGQALIYIDEELPENLHEFSQNENGDYHIYSLSGIEKQECMEVNNYWDILRKECSNEEKLYKNIFYIGQMVLNKNIEKDSSETKYFNEYVSAFMEIIIQQYLERRELIDSFKMTTMQLMKVVLKNILSNLFYYTTIEKYSSHKTNNILGLTLEDLCQFIIKNNESFKKVKEREIRKIVNHFEDFNMFKKTVRRILEVLESRKMILPNYGFSQDKSMSIYQLRENILIDYQRRQDNSNDEKSLNIKLFFGNNSINKCFS